MKAIIAAAIALGLSACAYPPAETSGYSSSGYGTVYAQPVCQFTVFEGKTYDRKNQIKVCLKSEQGQNFMEFHYDNANELAQRPLRVRAGEVLWEHVDTVNSVHDRLMVNENHYGITVLRLIQGGVMSGKLIVDLNGKEKKFILDPSSVALRTVYDGHSLTDYDVVPAASSTNRVSLGRVLAP